MAYEALVQSDKAEKPERLAGEKVVDIQIGIDEGVGTPHERVHIFIIRDSKGDSTLWVDGKVVKEIKAPRR